MAVDDPDSAVDELLNAVRAALFARRAALLDRVQRIEHALASYERAVESELAREFATEHGFKQPARAAVAPARAAELLEAAVRALPELHAASEPRPDSSAAATLGELARVSTQSASEVERSAYGALVDATAVAKVAVIGAISGRDRGLGLPPELVQRLEWIDTERDGAHAVGNLPQRVRQGRVAAVIILDRAVQHRHTEPVMAAARDAGVPIAFAGQGGKASMLRALQQIESALGK